MKKSEIYLACAVAIENSPAIAEYDLFSCLLLRHGQCGMVNVSEIMVLPFEETQIAEAYYRDLMDDPSFFPQAHQRDDKLLHQISEAFVLEDDYNVRMKLRNEFRILLLCMAATVAESGERAEKRKLPKLLKDIPLGEFP